MFTDLLESLQVNTNLQRISIEGTSWKRQGREASIRQALRQVAYVSVLKDARIKFLPPRSGRLFVCGPGFAGNTTLRSSLIRLSRARPEMCGWLCNARLPWLDTRRTEGTGIEVFCEDDDMGLGWTGQVSNSPLRSSLSQHQSSLCRPSSWSSAHTTRKGKGEASVAARFAGAASRLAPFYLKASLQVCHFYSLG